MTPIDYTQWYFEMVDGSYHPAGFPLYSRIPVKFLSDTEDQGEVLLTQHLKFKNRMNLDGKLLELGCAKGFFIEDMRNAGLDAYGVDVSEWAISQSSVPDYVTAGDVLEYMAKLEDKSFDIVFGGRFLPCFDDNTAAKIVDESKRIGSRVIFIVDDINYYGGDAATISFASVYYNVKTLKQWQEFCPGCEVYSILEVPWPFK